MIHSAGVEFKSVVDGISKRLKNQSGLATPK